MNKKLLLFTLVAFSACQASASIARPNENRSSNNRIFKRDFPDRTPPRRTRAAGSRGNQCSHKIATNLTVFHPFEETGTTAKSHPTFLFYLDRVPTVPLRFSLVNNDTSKSLIHKEFEVKKSGLFALEIPANVPAMNIGDEHIFTLGLICEQNNPALDRYQRVYLRRVNTPKELSNANNNLERLNVLKSANIWYDAILAAYQSRNSPDSSQTIISELLEKLGSFEQTFLNSKLSFVSLKTKTPSTSSENI